MKKTTKATYEVRVQLTLSFKEGGLL